jgi:hydroxymethylbilane synthase
LPIAAHAVLHDLELRLSGLVASRDGAKMVRDEVSGPCGEPERLGAGLANRLLARGAAHLIKNA